MRKPIFTGSCVTTAIVVMAISMAGLAACSSKSTPASISNTVPAGTTSQPTASTSAPVTSNHLAQLQQNGHLAVTFHALMTFNTSGKTITFPSELFVPPVPIAWSGTSFAGRLEESGPGEDVTDEVSGTVSADGTTLISMVYWRQVLRTGVNSGTYYHVTLQSLPIVVPSVGTFNGSGVDLQKHVVNIDYADGSLSGGRIVPATTYVSTDWTTGAGQMPSLSLTFTR